MRRSGRKCFGIFIAAALLYILLSLVALKATNNTNPWAAAENARWVATSKYWLDRQACRWIGVCGAMHLNSNGWTWGKGQNPSPSYPPEDEYDKYWHSGPEDPDSWSKDERQRRKIPQYVFDHAPYVHLFSGEQFWPSDLVEHLLHTTARLNYTTVQETDSRRNLSNLDELNDLVQGNHGRYVYLQSDDNVEDRPAWLVSDKNIPDSPKRVIGEPNKPPRKTPIPGSDDDDNVLLQAGALPSLQPADRLPSSTGRCGGNSGFTCSESGFGPCCSIYGWCGDSKIFCEDYCDPLHGDCVDPLDPPVGPKEDLRRHVRDFGKIENKPSQAGKSQAPAFLITVDKGNGTLDAFWFFFYSYNLGQKVLNIRFGNHVGDWEHTLVRFQDGKPQAMFLSEHDFGAAYTWHAIEKYMPNPDGSETMLGSWGNRTIEHIAKRPVVYSAIGSHAMYGTPGLHPYILPLGLLHDQTDRGPLWDPALNVKSFTYDDETKEVRASTRNPNAPTAWFHFAGHWGDKYYPLSDRRQYRIAGQYHYDNGPTGPKFKNLVREQVCQRSGHCEIHEELGMSGPNLSPPGGDDEEGGLPGGNRTDDGA